MENYATKKRIKKSDLKTLKLHQICYLYHKFINSKRPIEEPAGMTKYEGRDWSPKKGGLQIENRFLSRIISSCY